ncbi:MAG: DNA recombination protein RmuC [Clostridiales bacterium]|nr:DNA recombination protein RmuC [Clostridiales bacterium]
MTELFIAMCIIAGLLLVLLVLLLVRTSALHDLLAMTDHLSRKGEENRKEILQNVGEAANQSVGLLSLTVTEQQKNMLEQQKHLTELQDRRMANLEQKLDAINETTERRLLAMQRSNEEKLEKMRLTVDEKLQKTLEDRLSQSFRQVNHNLEQVYRGLGEMQALASGVGDLKKVLSNVKTRGILGEIQLGAILEQILPKERYAENVATRPGSSDRVEFAVRLPGDEEGRTVYLPIDAKFPADIYASLRDAQEAADKEMVLRLGKELEQRIKSFAKDIRDKYVEPPYTTDFAIMFLPVEGLYAEVVQRGMVETLQREYKVNIAGPSTMAALLNSLQMGFRTLAIQKHTGEVWKVLGEVKTEFETFSTVLEKTRERLRQADEELDKLVGTRTNQIRRKLRNVTTLEEPRV